MDATLVSPSWLRQRLHAPGIRVLDASWHLPAAGRDAGAEFLAGHIPGAMAFDIDVIADSGAPLPRTVPDLAGFGQHMDRLGISPTDHVVLYDTLGLYSAPRAWWMLRLCSHEKISILSGGLPAWQVDGGEIETGPARPRPTGTAYSGVWRARLLSRLDEVAEASGSASAQIVDVRAPAAFAGNDTPRTGHIPGAVNLPFVRLIDAGGRLLPADQLRNAFRDAGIRLEDPMVFSCGSGITACIGALAADVAGASAWSVFGGSWADWARHDHLPIERS